MFSIFTSRKSKTKSISTSTQPRESILKGRVSALSVSSASSDESNKKIIGLTEPVSPSIDSFGDIIKSNNENIVMSKTKRELLIQSQLQSSRGNFEARWQADSFDDEEDNTSQDGINHGDDNSETFAMENPLYKR